MLTNCEKSPVLTASVDSIINLRADKKVIAIAEGETVITASVGEIEATCTIFISDISLENVVLTAPESIVAGETGVTVTAEVEPQGYNPDNLVWSFKAVPETLELEYESVKSSEYIVKVRNYVEGAKVTVIVSGKKETAVAELIAYRHDYSKRVYFLPLPAETDKNLLPKPFYDDKTASVVD